MPFDLGEIRVPRPPGPASNTRQQADLERRMRAAERRQETTGAAPEADPDPVAPTVIDWVREGFTLNLSGTSDSDSASLPAPWPVGVWTVSIRFQMNGSGTGDLAAKIEYGLKLAGGTGSTIWYEANTVALTDAGVFSYGATISGILTPGSFYGDGEETFAVYATTDGTGNLVDITATTVSCEVIAVRLGDGPP